MSDQSTRDFPPMKDLTIENITENVHIINSKCSDPRMRFLLERLVNHLHDFARETRLSIPEWEAAIEFLVEVGKISTNVRHEFVLLSDVLGLSLLVDAIDHPKLPSATEGTVLGPFHTSDAHHVVSGANISHDPDGEPLLAVCSIKDTQGRPIPGVSVDVWETDSKGFYDVQYADRTTPDCRTILESDEEGMIYFKAIVPVPYPIPHDGPVGQLLQKLKRHPYRPSHMHFMFKKLGYDRLITALYLRGDPYETSDAVFGVKQSLIIDLYRVGDVEGLAEKHGVSAETKLLRHDFVLITENEALEVRKQEAWKEAARQGGRLNVLGGVLVPAQKESAALENSSRSPLKAFHIFGSGIAFSISPIIHNAGFQHQGLPYQYDIRESPTIDDVAHLIRADSFGGASVTMPHKLQVQRYCDQLTETARAIGAVNTLIVNAEDEKRFIIGDNTDWSGLHSIVREYIERSHHPVNTGLVIGAGGASRAALYALHRAGVRTIYLANRTLSAAETVRESFEHNFNVGIIPNLEQWPDKPDIIIGTVPADKTTEQQFANLFGSKGLCIDMSYKPRQTPLLTVAQRQLGWEAVTGVQVLIAQAFEQYRLWTGLQPPKDAMLHAVMAHEARLEQASVEGKL
ncbi:Aromatic compound dioxygenase [Pleurostoma richardsiae]|uniref:Aromatic compound dioxygenase n=1 Tax=Pleurostoma richardsiae TaxID=41990 RepID=A0AA38RCG8_9PEZI|nr:Aromatic compound dioxygenase [Pleurostoma richardsiae]